MSQNNRTGVGQMPQPPKSNNEVKVDLPNVTEAPKENIGPADSKEETKEESLEEDSLKVQISAGPSDSTKPVEKQKSAGIKVKALRKGFFRNLRRSPGSEFFISSKKEWGTWMECADKDLQKEMLLKHKEKMKKIREL